MISDRAEPRRLPRALAMGEKPRSGAYIASFSHCVMKGILTPPALSNSNHPLHTTPATDRLRLPTPRRHSCVGNSAADSMVSVTYPRPRRFVLAEMTRAIARGFRLQAWSKHVSLSYSTSISFFYISRSQTTQLARRKRTSSKQSQAGTIYLGTPSYCIHLCYVLHLLEHC